jgi:hypothetical protein
MKSLFILTLILTAVCGNAQERRPDEIFHDIFLQEVKKSAPANSDLQGLHMVADGNILQALAASDIDSAMKAVGQSDLNQLITATPAAQTPSVGAMNRRPLTLVIVPGVFAEFITTHAFEEVFSRPSDLRDQFHQQVQAAHVKDRVSLLKLYQYEAPEESISEERDLDQVILTGQVQAADGQTVRVILFNTEFTSLESLGNSRPRAMLFNRRLEKYLQLTGDQDLAFIGYSRGAILTLEMLAQAKVANRPWLANVKGVVSLSGVAFGSTLADDAMHNPDSPLGKIVTSLAENSGALENLKKDDTFNGRFNTYMRNSGRWAKFATVATQQLFQLSQGQSWSDFLNTFVKQAQINPRDPILLIQNLWQSLDLDKIRSYTDADAYNHNINCFRYFVDQLEESVKELSSAARLQWWKANALPTNPIYYSITAAMANPKSPFPNEAHLFYNPLAYANGSFDDYNLLQDHLQYQRLSGVALNDSQVSVAQATFLPAVISSLNPANAGLKTKFLGVAGTHHWGMALRQVNAMSGGGGANGFPREAMLSALATQIKLDSAAAQSP